MAARLQPSAPESRDRFVESRRGDIVAPPLGECDASSAESLSSDASMPASPGVEHETAARAGEAIDELGEKM